MTLYEYAFQPEFAKFAVGIGLVVSIIFYEKFQIAPGGMLVPGYIALFFNHPEQILYTFIISLLTGFFIEAFAKKHIILFGRRKFTAVVLTGAVLTFLSEALFTDFTAFVPFVGFQIVGIIIPGLIANEIEHQPDKPLKVLGGILVLSFMTYLIVVAVQNYVSPDNMIALVGVMGAVFVLFWLFVKAIENARGVLRVG
ncbi:MAG: poly-gamma-glutamate biosynthesis protein PgsC [Candidatus Micrarchaeia archaeon]|jgi:poly-gamma-glutamate biosynthesis protein PgsC/CapC